MRVAQILTKTIEIEDHGQVACGCRVVPFTQRTTCKIQVDRNSYYRRRKYHACGDSLVGRGIIDGDEMICTLDFSLPDTFNKVCIVRHIPTNEIVAKIIVPNYDGTVTLKAANPYYVDKRFPAEEIEIIAIVKKIERNLD